jgi:hypothetical protein
VLSQINDEGGDQDTTKQDIAEKDIIREDIDIVEKWRKRNRPSGAL